VIAVDVRRAVVDQRQRQRDPRTLVPLHALKERRIRAKKNARHDPGDPRADPNPTRPSRSIDHCAESSPDESRPTLPSPSGCVEQSDPIRVFVDDATSEVMELLFCESESAFSYFAALRFYLEQHGKPVALYSDKAGVFRVNRKEPEGGTGVPQFGRALSSLNIDIVCANTPAAKGRVERAHLTLQDRLVKELRLREISDVEAANAFAPEFIADYNRRFARAPRSEHDAHRPLQPADDLARIFCLQETRMVSKSLTLNYKRVLYVLDPTDAARAARKQRIRIEEREDGSMSFWHGEHELLATAFPKDHSVRQGEVIENKRLSEAMDYIREQQRRRAEEKIAKPSTTLRETRLLRAGTPRRTAPSTSLETPL